MLTVVHDADSSNEDAGSSRSLLDEIVRDGARQMLAVSRILDRTLRDLRTQVGCACPMVRIDKAPFHAARFGISDLGTKGGLRTDTTGLVPEACPGGPIP